MSSLGAQRSTRTVFHVPPSGGWWADVVLEKGALPALGSTTLTIADLAAPGTVTSVGYDAPATPRVRVVGGAGWDTPLPAPGATYSSPSGVRLSTVLRDLSAISGEPYDAPAEATLGPSYGWDSSSSTAVVRARAVLDDLVSRGAIPTWRVDPASGHTRFDAWPNIGAADGRGVTVDDRDLALGVRYCGLQGIVSALLPGSTLEGATTLRLVVTETSDDLRAEVWSKSTARASIYKMILDRFPWLARIGLAPSGALRIGSAANRTELEGGGPAALRVGDGGRLYFDPGIPSTTAPALYYSPSETAPYQLVKGFASPGITGGGLIAIPPNTPGTSIAPNGSLKVFIG